VCLLHRFSLADTVPTSSAFIALATSCVNVLVLITMHGRQLGWVCLGSCSADVSSTAEGIDYRDRVDGAIPRRLW
jgi:hypothetical protein